MKLVYSVKSVTLRILKSLPPQIYVHADGEVVSSGWNKPELSACVYVNPPADGIQEFHFLAEPPSGGIVLPRLMPITVEAFATGDPASYWGPGKPLKGVRICAQTNCKEASLEDLKVAEGPIDPVPWPWGRDWLQGGCDTPEICGMTLRTYNRGDMLPTDYLPDRANVELDPQGRRILRVWVG